MSRPAVTARMEKTQNAPGFVINGRNVRSFMAITRQAGPGEVGLVGLATVLGGDDMVGLVRNPCIVLVK
jgi:hypothetical protein